MHDDASKTGGADRTRIDMHEPYEVRHWCGVFACTEQQLRMAVETVGNNADAVQAFLKKYLAKPAG